MGGVGPSADNVLAESFNATLKRELLEGQSTFPDKASANGSIGESLQHPAAAFSGREDCPERVRAT